MTHVFRNNAVIYSKSALSVAIPVFSSLPVSVPSCNRDSGFFVVQAGVRRSTMSAQYSFPLLNDKEIAQCLHELGMQASLELLAKPTFEFVQPIYENLVTVLMGVSRWGDQAQRPEESSQLGARNSQARAWHPPTAASERLGPAGRSCSSRCLRPSMPWSFQSSTTSPSPPSPSCATWAGLWQRPASATLQSRWLGGGHMCAAWAAAPLPHVSCLPQDRCSWAYRPPTSPYTYPHLLTLQDLYKPEAPRLRRNLSAVINFAKYREEKLLAYTELQEQLEALLGDKEALAAEHEQLQAELQRLQDERAAELPVRGARGRREW